MSRSEFLEGFVPYREEIIKRYTENGAWENLTYGDLLDRAADRFPDNTAVIDERARITYGELRENVDRFALALIGLGIRPHDRLVIQLPNRCEFLVALFGMHKMGAVPVLAIPRHGRKEISTFFKLTGALGWILPLKDGKTDFRSLMEGVRPEAERLRHIIMPEDRDPIPSDALSMEKLIRELSPESLEKDTLDSYRPDPNDVAMLIPTGGTTGLPKMVPRSHNSLIVTNRIISETIDSSDKLLQSTPVGHAMAMQGAVNCAVYRGATLVLQGVPRPAEIMETIQREKVTRAFLVPTQLEGIINHPELEEYDLTSLKVVGTTGAALPRDVAERAYRYFTGIDCKFLGNELGASEGLLARGDPDDPLDVQLETVGRNVTPGSRYKVIGPEGNELPVNEEGELVASGPEVFTGYYRTPEEENRRVFTPDGYYRTGDLSRIDEQGYIRITGRIKDVIQRGGETLVPGEMEGLIRRHPQVEGVAVVGMPDPKLGERACAFVVTKQGRSLTFEEMTRFLKSEGAGVLLLPERLEVIDSLPLTGVGKVDKKALRKKIREILTLEG